jgi:hypothetical protein
MQSAPGTKSACHYYDRRSGAEFAVYAGDSASESIALKAARKNARLACHHLYGGLCWWRWPASRVASRVRSGYDMSPQLKRYACWALAISLLYTQSAMSMTMTMQMATGPMQQSPSGGQPSIHLPSDSEGQTADTTRRCPAQSSSDDQGFNCSTSGSCCSILSLVAWVQAPVSLPSAISDYAVASSSFQDPPLLHPPPIPRPPQQ